LDGAFPPAVLEVDPKEETPPETVPNDACAPVLVANEGCPVERDPKDDCPADVELNEGFTAVVLNDDCPEVDPNEGCPGLDPNEDCCPVETDAKEDCPPVEDAPKELACNPKELIALGNDPVCTGLKPPLLLLLLDVNGLLALLLLAPLLPPVLPSGLEKPLPYDMMIIWFGLSTA
jgi:hypothetical protein